MLISRMVWLNCWFSIFLLAIIRKIWVLNRFTLWSILVLILILILRLRISVIIIVLLIDWFTLRGILVILLLTKWLTLRCVLVTRIFNILVINILIWMFHIIKIRIIFGLWLKCN
jgi:hypothetical protein